MAGVEKSRIEPANVKVSEILDELVPGHVEGAVVVLVMVFVFIA